MATVTTTAPPKGLARKFHGCSKIGEYEMICKLGEGTFGEVHKARQVRTGNIVALKKILMHNEKDGFPITALREIKLLKMLCHENVLKLEEMAVERPKGEGRKRGILYMVTPYMDHDLSGLLDNQDVHFSEPQIKCYMLQLFKGLRYLHDNHILHRDMKAANLLINNRGRLQIADFGLARHYEEPVPQRGRGNGEAKRDYTSLVVTRWYRPPELLLQLRRYTPAIDMWGAGCVFGEMFKRKPILAGTSDLNQAHIIFDLVGSPNDENMPGWNQLPGCEGVRSFPPRKGNLAQTFKELGPGAISLLSDLLMLDWRKRINAIDAIDHPYFKQDPKPMREEDIPRFQDSHELDRRNGNGRGHRPALPPAPAGGTVGVGPNGEWTGSGPSNGGPPWANGDRRGPQRAPYDHRPPPPPPRHQPHWGTGTDHNRNPSMSYDSLPRHHSSLPPPPGEGRIPLPPPPHQYRGAPQDRGHYQNRGHQQNHGNHKDTYIPNYDGRPPTDRHSRGPEDPRPRNERRGSVDSRNSRDGYTDSHSDRGRGYRDRDGPPRDGHGYGRDGRDFRARSRSPIRRDDARDRRDRDIYRR
ncbi:Pkinase-domain-containing protein [Delitschia confertaspora ATCC 74209]|uniref:Serine/threonine-protein kinase BUR1 n=1 Tax=Delitschia confertaspora ATCC 74209 TaxID=1513339 RepID=A0A9P4MXN9_9PLEO|nr:Pkinase-domain-containing protein [Delitschia confertaspora ATCC 74209]